MAGLPMTQRPLEEDEGRTPYVGDPRSRPRLGGRYLGMQQGGGGSGSASGGGSFPSPLASGSQLRGARGAQGAQSAEADRNVPGIYPTRPSFPRTYQQEKERFIFPQTYNFHAQQSGSGRGFPSGFQPYSTIPERPRTGGGGRRLPEYFTRPDRAEQGGGRRLPEYFTRPQQDGGSFHQQQRLPDYFTRPRQVEPRVRPYVMPKLTPQQPFIGMRPTQPRVGAKPLPILPYRPRQHIETRDIIPMLPVEPNVQMLLQQGYLRLPRVGGTMGRFGVRPPNPGRFQGMKPESFNPPQLGRRRGEVDSATVKAGGVVVILTDRSGKVLMLQRGPEQEWMGGAFDLPAMKTPTYLPSRPFAVQAVQAETGLVMGEQNLKCLFTAYHPEAGEVAFFHGVVEPGLENGIAVNPPEHVGYMWVDLARDNDIEGVPYMDLVTYVMSEEKMLGVSNYGADEKTEPSMTPLYVLGAIALILATM